MGSDDEPNPKDHVSLEGRISTCANIDGHHHHVRLASYRQAERVMHGRKAGPLIRVGTSGWQYRDWRGPFYPDELTQRRWLEHYAKCFSTVEVNATFYHLPPPETFRKWRDETSDGFLIAVKASRFITHVRRLEDCAEPMKLLVSRAKRLGSKLGPFLVQLPPGFRADLDRLRGFVRVAPAGVRMAFEFRDPSWFVEDVFDVIDAAGAALVLADRPRARIPDVVTGGWSYVRFHQGTERAPGYSRSKLRRWADRIESLGVREVFTYFNNDTGGAAVRDAETFRELLRARSLPVA